MAHPVDRNYVTFESTIGLDEVWNENDDLVVPGGRAVGTLLRSGLESRGYLCDELSQRSFYGWEFGVALDAGRVDCVLQVGESDSWLLICDYRAGLLRTLFGTANTSSFRQFLNVLSMMMQEEPLLLNSRWYHRADYNRGGLERGTPTPFDE